MQARNRSLDVVAGDFGPRRRALEQSQPLGHELPIPARTILVGEGEQLAELVRAAGQAGCMEIHE